MRRADDYLRSWDLSEENVAQPRTALNGLTIEQACERLVVGELLGIPLTKWFREIGLPEYLPQDIKRKHSEEYRRAKNRVTDACFEIHMKARLAIMDRLVVASENATEVLACAVEGKDWHGQPVTAAMKQASDSVLRRLADLAKVKWTPQNDTDQTKDEGPDELDLMGIKIPMDAVIPVTRREEQDEGVS